MRRLGGLAVTTLAFLGALGLPSAAPPPDDPNQQRLASMPLELRQRLAERLNEFALLPAADQAAIRELDAKLAAESESDRADHQAVMHRYHLWFQSLPENKKNEVEQTPPDKRMALVARLRAEQKAAVAAAGEPTFLSLAELGTSSPTEQAFQIRVWLSLDAKERDELSRLADPARIKRLNELAKVHGVKPIPRPDRLEPEPLIEAAAKGRWVGMLKRIEEAKRDRRAAEAKKEIKLDEAKRLRTGQRIAENLYFLDHPPDRVRGDNLMAFDSALPPWIRNQFDALPPEEARRRLSVLYRLVFPSPEEYASRPKPAGKKASGTPEPPKPPGPPPAPPAPANTKNVNPF